MKKLLITILLLQFISFIALAHETEQFETDDGETLYFTRDGSGSKIILLCGGPGFGASLMKPWLDTLANQFESVLFEQRGTGLSRNAKLDSSTINFKRACQDIDNLREHLGETKLTLCGYSWGCMLALAYAARYPTKVKNLVLLSPGPGGVDLSTIRAVNDNEKWNTYPTERDSIAYWRKDENRVSDPNRAELLTMVFSFMNRFYDHNLGRKLLEKYLQNAEYNPEMSKLMWKDMKKGFNIKAALKRYKGQCSIIRPRQEVIPAEIILKIKDALPQTKVFFLEKCGHLADLEKPKELFSLLRVVLAEKDE
ncbi:MAG: alpha/beta hydrolase [Candidatus Marinimicrobia bacterium]|nr:alpha/beta hydrolase [Candidatus Neomarinimicrobiota bacterium]